MFFSLSHLGFVVLWMAYIVTEHLLLVAPFALFSFLFLRRARASSLIKTYSAVVSLLHDMSTNKSVCNLLALSLSLLLFLFFYSLSESR